MKLVIIAILSLATANTFAAKSAPTIYILNGKTVETQVALMAAIQGKSVLGCKPVESKVSKTGTSIGLRNKKLAEK